MKQLKARRWRALEGIELGRDLIRLGLDVREITPAEC